MSDTDVDSLLEHFSSLTHPRVDRTELHLSSDILGIAICAVICGADTWIDIKQYGQAKHDWLISFLDLPNGIPSHDTFARLFARLDPGQFQRCFLSRVGYVREQTGGKLPAQVVGIDGKTSRRSFNPATDTGPLHMVSAWAAESRLVLGQLKVDDKSNEIRAIPELISLLEVSGCIVTIDAMGCRKEMASTIINKGADYVLALKGNQNTLFEDAELYFRWAEANKYPDTTCDSYEQENRGRGRIERRRTTVTDDIQGFRGYKQWAGHTTVAMVESWRRVGDEQSHERRYYISSLGTNARQVGEAVRGHWCIENSLHRVLDIAFREDESRARKDNAPQNFAVLRHIALNLLKQEKTNKHGVKVKRNRGGWDDAYLLKVLGF